MKKTLISLVLVIVLTLSLCVFAQAAPKTGVQYAAPKADGSITIDGKGTEAAWKNALLIKLNPQDLVKNGGWSQAPTKKGANGTLKVLWSDKGPKGAGLYFMWDVKDSTQSFAYPNSDGHINAMDCVQVLLDPLYQRRGKLTGDTCQVYTFAPYSTRADGNGFAVYPELDKKGSSWYEHYSWVASNDSIGVRAKAVLDGKKDNIHEENNRNFLVSGYHIEAYIPFSAMSVKGGSPKAEIGTKVGIGFLFVDYDWDYDHCDWVVSNFHKYQKLLNLSADFTNGKRTSRNNIAAYPVNWNTLYLADKDGKLPEGLEVETEPTVDATQKVSELKASFEALKAEDYTPETYEALKAAYDAMIKFKDEDTSKEAVAAKEAFATAFAALVKVEAPEEPSTEPTTPDEETKPTEKDDKENTNKPAEKEGLSTGAIVAIVIGAIALIAIIVVVVVVVSKKKKTDAPADENNNDAE